MNDVILSDGGIIFDDKNHQNLEYDNRPGSASNKQNVGIKQSKTSGNAQQSPYTIIGFSNN